jgi:hypothetical protein
MKAERLFDFGSDQLVADIRTADPEDDVCSDIGGVIGDALEIAAYDDALEGLASDGGAILNDPDELHLRDAVHAVDLIVHLTDVFSQLSITIEQRLDGRANHLTGVLTHIGDIDGEIDDLFTDEVETSVDNAHGLIADTLEVAVDLNDSEDEAEIDGHGLFLGEQIEGHVVDFAMGGVDGSFVLAHILAELLIPLEVGVNGGGNSLLRNSGHGEQLVFQFCELLMKVDARQDIPQTALCTMQGDNFANFLARPLPKRNDTPTVVSIWQRAYAKRSSACWAAS